MPFGIDAGAGKIVCQDLIHYLTSKCAYSYLNHENRNGKEGDPAEARTSPGFIYCIVSIYPNPQNRLIGRQFPQYPIRIVTKLLRPDHSKCSGVELQQLSLNEET